MNQIKAALTTAYQGITIEYLEEPAKFRFELRGRERKVDTLAQAKAAIDKPEPEKKPAKKFQRVQVVHTSGYMGLQKNNRKVVTITSIAEDNYNSDRSDPRSAWIVDARGERSKEGVHSLYLIHPSNDAKWAQYDALSATIDRLEKERKDLALTIETVNLKDYLIDEEKVGR